jgi:predicted metal-dependent HD superfamily phosphohydrolase
MDWNDAVRMLGGNPRPTDLDVRYAEQHRRYHDLTHAKQVVRDAVALTDGQDGALVALAGWAHDVVYDGRAGDDERASAAWARRQLTSAGLADTDVTRVEGLVLATFDHTAPSDDHLADALLDADLAILGAAPDAYERYRVAVRAEYAHVTDAQWRVGRAAVLRSLLDRESLYRTVTARERWAAPARRNLAGELAAL